MLRLVAAGFVLLIAFTVSSFAAEPTPGASRIRFVDAELAAPVSDGIERSPTVRALVERIEAGNVIVYVRLARSLPGGVLARVSWIGAKDTFRFVLVSVKQRPKSNSLIATLAHEMQHVLEIQEAEWVVDQRSLRELYRRIGTRSGLTDDVWDTVIARATGDQVLRELKGQTAVTTDAEER